PYGHPLQVLPLRERPEGFGVQPARCHHARLPDDSLLPRPRLAEKASDSRFEIATNQSASDQMSDRVPRAESLKPEEVREAALPAEAVGLFNPRLDLTTGIAESDFKGVPENPPARERASDITNQLRLE